MKEIDAIIATFVVVLRGVIVSNLTGDMNVYRKFGRVLGLEASKLALGIETLPATARCPTPYPKPPIFPSLAPIL